MTGDRVAGVPDGVWIRSVTAVVSAACNLRCRYCYQNRRTPGQMPWAVLRAAIDRLLNGSETKLALQFTGGEPLLAFPLIKRAALYLDRVCPGDREVTCDLVTNGTLMTETHIAFFADQGFKVQLSFDGVPAAQALRGRGTFRRLDRLLDRIRQHEPGLFHRRFRVAVTVTREVLPWLADSVDYLIGKGVREIALSPAMGPAVAWESGDGASLDRQFSRIFATSIRHYHRTGDVPLRLFRKGTHDPPARASRRGFTCAAAEGGRVTVDVDGQAYACPMLAESFQAFPETPLRQRLIAMRLGDIRDAAFPDRLRKLPEAARRTGLFRHTGSRYSFHGRCARCRFAASCHVCPVPAAREAESAEPDRVPDFLCAFNQAVLAHRERFPGQPGAFDVLTGRAPLASLLGPLGRLARS